MGNKHKKTQWRKKLNIEVKPGDFVDKKKLTELEKQKQA